MNRLELEFRQLDYQHCFKWPFGSMVIYLFSNIVCTPLTWLVEETSDEKKGQVKSSKALGSERTLSQLACSVASSGLRTDPSSCLICRQY